MGLVHRFRDGAVRLAVDIHCDDSATGAFRVRLTSRWKKLIRPEIVDTPELDDVRDTAVAAMAGWAGSLRIERVED